MTRSKVEKYNALAREGCFERKPFLLHSRETVLKLLSPRQGKKLLDVGCGSGRYLEFFEAHGLACYGLDISPIAVKNVRRRGLKNIKVCDIQTQKVPFREKFDYFLMIDVLEHLENPERALNNILKNIKGGATGVIITPCFNLTKFKFLIPLYRNLLNVDAEKAGHERIFSESELSELLKRYFIIKQINYKNCLGEIMRARFHKNFGIFDLLFHLSSVSLFKSILRWGGSSIFVKVQVRK